MAKIPFSIDYRPQIESGEYKVETKNGVSVRIICWDAKGSNDRKDIIGLVGSTLGSENIQRYDTMGHLIADSARIGNKDLFIVTPDPELLSNLDEAAEEYAQKHQSHDIYDCYGNPESDTIGKNLAFRAGAEWMARQMKQEQPVSKEVNGAAIDFADNARKQLYSKDYAIASIADYDHGCIDGFKAGAEWMAGQGVTEVSRLYRDPNPPHEGLFFGVLPFFSTLQMVLNYQEGEEVIVQIRKK